MENDQEDEHVNKNSQIGKLIGRVKLLEKKPVLDNSLSEILEIFLQKISQSEDFLVNGIFQINFAEAALLLQSSALIYSKKVDLLWDSVNECQRRMIQYNAEENQDELKKLEDRVQKYKRRRKIVEKPNENDKNPNSSQTFNIDWNDVQNVQNLNYERDSKLLSGWYKKMVKKLDLQPASRNQSYGDKQSHFRGINSAIYDKDQDDEFVVHTSKLESVMRLDNLIIQNNPKFEEFSFNLYTEICLIPKFLAMQRLKFDDLEKHSEELEKYINFCKDRIYQDSDNNDNDFVVKSSSPELRQTAQKLRRVSVSSTVCSRLSPSDLDKIFAKECQENSSTVNKNELDCDVRIVTPVIIDVDEIANNNNSCINESQQQSSNIDSQDIQAQVHPQELETCAQSQEENSAQAQITEEVAMVSTQNPQEISVAVNSKDPPSKDSDNETISQHVSDGAEESVRVEKAKRIAITSILNKINQDDPPDSPCNEIEIVELDSEDLYEPSTAVKTPRKQDNCEVPEKRRKMSKAALKKLATGITVDLREFSLFFSANYRPEENEGQVELCVFDLNDPVETSSRIDPDEQLPLSQISSVLCSQDSGYLSQTSTAPFTDISSQSVIDGQIGTLTQNNEQPTEGSTKLIQPLNSGVIEDQEDDIPLSELSRVICSQDSGFFDASALDIASVAPPPSLNVSAPTSTLVSNTASTSTQNSAFDSTDCARTLDFPPSENDEQPLFQRVQEWKKHMSEKLKHQTPSDFDIHEYGAKIMDKFDDAERPVKKFGDMVKGKSSAEVARFFISTLQLANTGNVKICGAQIGKLSNETFSLKLITKDRYYDRLKDYMAPSEENLKERLASARKLQNKRTFWNSSASGHSGQKRCRFE